MKKFFHLVLAFSCLVLFSCEKEETGEIDQSKIHTEYEVYYDANKEITVAKVTFRNASEEGDKLKLSSSAKVTFNDTELTLDEGQTLYSLTLNDEVLSGTFEFTDTDGEVFTNSIDLKSIAFQTDDDTLSTVNDFVFTWIGDAVRTDESVSFNINDYYSGNVTLFVQEELNATSITMLKADLADLVAGTSSCIVERTYSPSLKKKSSAGGFISSRYRAKNQSYVIE